MGLFSVLDSRQSTSYSTASFCSAGHALVAYQVVEIDDVASGLLYYVAQSFLLAGSIFGLHHYIDIIKKHYHDKQS